MADAGTDGRGAARVRQRVRVCGGVLLLCTAIAVPMPAVPRTTTFAALRALDTRVAIVSGRLRIGNATLCRRTQPDFGFTLHAIDQYAPAAQAAARAAYRFAMPVSVAVVIPGGRADRAGIRADDGLVAVAGVPVGGVATAGGGRDARPSAATRDRVLARLAALPPARPVALTLVRDGVVRVALVAPQPACAVEIELVPGTGDNAAADDRTIQLGMALVERIDDPALATVVAHELAHVMLDHRRRLDAAGVRRGVAGEFGRNRHLIRQTEDEADRLSAYVLVNAGYEAAAAMTFWQRQGGGPGGGAFRSRTHAGSATRARIIAAELPAIAASTVRPIKPAFLGMRDVPLR